MRSEAYQYFGFPLLGLLVLMRAWIRLSDEPVAPAPAAVRGPDARIVSL